jgi:hypothetical protein
MNAQVGTVELEFLPRGTVVCNHSATTPYANEELVALTMSMLTPSLPIWYPVDQEIAFYRERDVVFKLTYAEMATDIGHHGHLI